MCQNGHVSLGGARLPSRGVEGVTGCSGEGLHSSHRRTVGRHCVAEAAGIQWHSSPSHSLPASVCVFSDRAMAHPHLKVMAF